MNKLRLTSGLFKSIRCYSTGEKIIQVVNDDKTGVSTISLQRPSVNSLNTELLQELGNAIDNAKKIQSKGIILTSNIQNIFSAGLDLMEFYKTDSHKLETFWKSLQNTWLKLYTSSVPTVALINGHSPAGGCLLAMSCEHRVMIGPLYTIGLNEAKIGIPAPFWFMDVMASVIGRRNTEACVLSGRMMNTKEALDLGLVDEMAENLTDAKERVNSYLQNTLTVVDEARYMMKLEFRKDIVDKFLSRKDSEAKFIVNAVLEPSMQKKIEVYFESMKKKK